MPRRKIAKAVNPDACIFCLSVVGYPILGTLVEKCEMKMHTNCVVSYFNTFNFFQFTASGLSQRVNADDKTVDHIDGFLIEDIILEVKRGRSLYCSVCHNPYACVGCNVNSCQSTFHLPCLIKVHGLTIFKDPFPSYCRRHSPKQDIDKPSKQCKEPPNCSICLFSMLPDPEDLDIIYTSRKKNKVRASLSNVFNENIEAVKESRRPRRSCVTPKRIMVSNGLSSMKRKLISSTSSWELDSSSPEQNEQNSNDFPGQRAYLDSHLLLNPSMIHLPRWLSDYISMGFSSEKRMYVLEAWRYNSVYGFCCPLAWMHRGCIAGFAISAALHYLKCPYCANKRIFIHSLIDAGIWIPDRDAAWELEPGAYSDLAPVAECSFEDNKSSTSTITTSRNVRSQRQSSGELLPRSSNEMRDRNSDLCNGTNSSDSPHSTDSDHNAVLSLIWNNDNFTAQGRPRRRRRRCTQLPQGKFTNQPTRISRRYSCTLNETPLRQITLGSYISTFRAQSSR